MKPEELQEACRLVENACRSIGKDCQIIFTLAGVELAPLSDSGSTTAKSLYDAIVDASK